MSVSSNDVSAGLDTLATVLNSVAKVLFVRPEEVLPDAPLTDQGLDSILTVELVTALNSTFGLKLRAADVTGHGTARRLAARLDELTGRGSPTARALLGPVRESLSEVLLSEVGPEADDTSFTDLGMDSILMVEFISVLNDRLGRSDDESLLREHPTPALLAAHLAGRQEEAPGATEAIGATEVPEAAAAASAAQPAPAAPDEVLTVLREAVAQVLPHVPAAEVGPGMSLRQWGASSLERTDIAVQAMHRLAVRVPAVELAEAEDLGALAGLLRRYRERG